MVLDTARPELLETKPEVEGKKPRERKLGISPVSFLAPDSANAWVVFPLDAGGWINKTANKGVFIAINLPDGATITNAIVHGNTAGTETFTFNRVTHLTGVLVPLRIGNINTDLPIFVKNLVDNELFSYNLATSGLAVDDEIFGAVITYTL